MPRAGLAAATAARLAAALVCGTRAVAATAEATCSPRDGNGTVPASSCEHGCCDGAQCGSEVACRDVTAIKIGAAAAGVAVLAAIIFGVLFYICYYRPRREQARKTHPQGGSGAVGAADEEAQAGFNTPCGIDPDPTSPPKPKERRNKKKKKKAGRTPNAAVAPANLGGGSASADSINYNPLSTAPTAPGAIAPAENPYANNASAPVQPVYYGSAVPSAPALEDDVDYIDASGSPPPPVRYGQPHPTGGVECSDGRGVHHT